MTAVEFDLDDTTTCPTGESCGVCGTGDDLAVGAAGTMFGVYPTRRRRPGPRTAHPPTSERPELT